MRFTAGLSLLCALAIIDLPVSGAEWWVDDDGAENPQADFASIQAAVDVAASGDVIHVHPGVYFGGGDEVVNVGEKSLTIKSTNGQYVTTIDGGGVRRGVVCPGGHADRVVGIVGFTIQDCQIVDTSWSDEPLQDASSGAAIAAKSGSLALTNCNIWNCTATATHWANAAITARDMSLELHSCSLRFNESNYGAAGVVSHGSTVTCTWTLMEGLGSSNEGAASGGAVIEFNGPTTAPGEPDLTLRNCTFRENETEYFEGMISGSGDVEISDCTVMLNNADDIVGLSVTSLVVDGCEFSNNTSGGWGGGLNVHSISDEEIQISDCQFEGNSATGRGGALYCSSVNLHIEGSTFDRNVATSDGGAIALDGSTSALSLTNSTMSRNRTLGVGAAVHLDDGQPVQWINVSVCGNIGAGPQVWGGEHEPDGLCVAGFCEPLEDQDVDLQDLFAVLERFGESCQFCDDMGTADLNLDRVIDVHDLEMLVGSWGDPCGSGH